MLPMRFFPYLAVVCQDGHDAMMLTEYVVTRHYRAPEVHEQSLRFCSLAPESRRGGADGLQVHLRRALSQYLHAQ